MSTDIDADETRFVDPPEFEVGKFILGRATAAHSRYITSGKVTDALIKSVVGLSHLDTVYRTGFVDENLGQAYPEDMRDLRKLISLVNPKHFRAKKRCVVNPSFGAASRLVGGADADIIIDDTLIEIKTVKNLVLERDYFNQLMGYVLLRELNKHNGATPGPKVSKIGVYFARHAHLEVFDLRKIINKGTFPSFSRWFIEMIDLRHRRYEVRMKRRRAILARLDAARKKERA